MPTRDPEPAPSSRPPGPDETMLTRVNPPGGAAPAPPVAPPVDLDQTSLTMMPVARPVAPAAIPAFDPNQTSMTIVPVARPVAPTRAATRTTVQTIVMPQQPVPAPDLGETLATLPPQADSAKRQSSDLPRAAQPTVITNLQVEGRPGEGSSRGQGSSGLGAGMQTWGDFELTDLLGKGGMGSVYRGRQTSLDRQVAVKVLPAHLSENDGFKKRFLLEARAVARISSPHVVQVYAAGVHEGQHYFAMEYVEGEDLARRIANGYKPTYQESLDLVIQATRGLVAAGEFGIVHRDIKPANMMVTKRGQVKIMDFGLVRLARSEETGLTMAGTIMGTVSYFSPEQGRGEACDCRTDIYAMGVVFYELLTGKLPFTGGDPTSVIYQHIHSSPKPPKEINPNIPENFQAVVLKCLQKDPARRYQTAADLLADLDAVRSGQAPPTAFIDPDELRRGGTIVKTGSFTGKRTGGGRKWLAAGLLVAVAGTVAVIVMRTREPGLPPAQAPVASAPTGKPAPTAAVPTPTPTPTPTPAPAHAAVAANPGLPAARAALVAGDLAFARALVDAGRRDHPDDQAWMALAGEVDRAEGRAELGAAQAALARGDLDGAGAHAATAQGRLGDTVELQALLTQLLAREGDRKQRARALDEATGLMNEGKPDQAEALLVRLAGEHPDDPAIEQALRLARKLKGDAEARAQAVRDQLAQGEQALARKDFDGALTAFTAAKQLDPTSARASQGLNDVTVVKQQIAAVRERFEAALAARDLGKAQAELGALRTIAPASPVLVLAENQFAASKLVEEAAQKAAAEREAQLGGEAQALVKRIDDPSQPIPALEQALAAFVVSAGGHRPEQALLETRLEDRRQRVQVEQLLAGLDAAVAKGDAPAIAKAVADPTWAESLGQLATHPGLIFAEHLDEFIRTDRTAHVRAALRHGFDVFPEQRMTVLYDLRRDDAGWVITAAHIKP